MTTALSRLQAVESDVHDALARTQAILDFVRDNPPVAEIRVAILNNVIVSVVSIAEEGLRSLFREYISIVEEAANDYQTLRKELSDSNIRCAAELLHKSIDAKHNIDPIAVTRELLKCLNSEAGFRLFKDGITYNKSNMRSREITDVAKRIGIRKLWENLCARPVVRDLAPDALDDQMEQVILERWNALFDERDTVVHRISQATGWGETIISPYISFVRSIISGIVLCLADDAGEHNATPPTNVHATQAETAA